MGDISIAELAAFVSERKDILAAEDAAIAFARSIGLSRLAATSRLQLEAAIASAQAAPAKP